MGKRSPILPEDYNPVGARLQKALTSTPEPEPLLAPKPIVAAKTLSEVSVPHAQSDKVLTAQRFARPLESAIPQAASRREPPEAMPDAPREKEMMVTALRCRCTEAERKKWHDYAKEVTGEHNQFSHVMRALFLLLENSHEHLLKLLPEMKTLKIPAKQDAIGVAIYEQKLSQILWDGIKGAGRPRG